MSPSFNVNGLFDSVVNLWKKSYGIKRMMAKDKVFPIQLGPGALQFGRWLPWAWVCSAVDSLDWCVLWPLTLITEHWSTGSPWTNAGGPGSVLQLESLSLRWSLCSLLWPQSSFLAKWKIFFVMVSIFIATERSEKGWSFNFVNSKLLLNHTSSNRCDCDFMHSNCYNFKRCIKFCYLRRILLGYNNCTPIQKWFLMFHNY